jgi:hypothetical protein
MLEEPAANQPTGFPSLAFVRSLLKRDGCTIIEYSFSLSLTQTKSNHWGFLMVMFIRDSQNGLCS